MVGLLLCISCCGSCLSHLNYWQLNKAKIKLHWDSSHQITVTHQPHNPSQTANPPIWKPSVKTQPQCPATSHHCRKITIKKGPSPKSSAPSKSPTTQEVTKRWSIEKKTFHPTWFILKSYKLSQLDPYKKPKNLLPNPNKTPTQPIKNSTQLSQT